MEKLYTSKEIEMSKLKLTIGYKSFVLPAAKAVQLLEMLDSIELYEDKYHSGEEGKPGFYTHHVYDMDANEKLVTGIEHVTDTNYKMYKLAGKPQS